MKHVLRKIALSALPFALLYAGAALDLSAVPVNKLGVVRSGVPLYLRCDGGHLDWVLPVHNMVQDWSRIFSFQNTKSKDPSLPWIAIGWGEKGFYLHPPVSFWGTLSTSLEAASGMNSAVLRVEYLPSPVANDTCRLLHASGTQYQKLTAFILQSLSPGHDGFARWIPAPEICGADDAFYEARGTYSIFNTCNTWVNSGLKTAGMKACVWTSLPQAVLDKYPVNAEAKSKIPNPEETNNPYQFP